MEWQIYTRRGGNWIHDFDMHELMTCVNHGTVGGDLGQEGSFNLDEFEECLWQCEDVGYQYW